MFIALFKHCYCIVVASRPGRLEVEANSYRRIGEPTEAPTETEERVKFSCHDCHDSTRRLCASLCNLAKNMKELRNMTNMTNIDSMMKKCHRYRSI